MEVIRIKLRQSKAHYGRPECVGNRMTYPLPPYSTIIGALHNACGYKVYNPMNISVQGKFKSMQREVHNQHILLNRREDDRGILIYLQNPNMLSSGYKVVAREVKEKKDSSKDKKISFEDNKTIRIEDREYMQKFWALLEVKRKLDKEKKSLKNEETIAKEEMRKQNEYLKTLDENTDEYLRINKELEDKKKRLEKRKTTFEEKKNKLCEKPLSHFQTLIRSPRYIETLYDVELILHIQADESVLSDIECFINNFSCLGRSEDFVDVLECKRVNLLDSIDREYKNRKYAGYIERRLLEEDENSQNFDVCLSAKKEKHKNIDVRGTTYYIPKNYTVTKDGRRFEYKKVTYISEYCVDENSKNVFVDQDGYIVNLV